MQAASVKDPDGNEKAPEGEALLPKGDQPDSLELQEEAVVYHSAEDPLTATVLVMVCGTWFLVVAMYVCMLPDFVDPEVVAHWKGMMPWRFYEWNFVGNLTVSLLSLLGLCTRNVPTRHLLCLALYINTCATLTAYLVWMDVPAFLLGAHGRPVFVLRPAMWGCATPVTIYLLSRLRRLPRKQVYTTLILDVVMIWTGIASEFMPIVPRVLAWIASLAIFVHIMRTIYLCTVQGNHKSLRFLGASVMVLWLNFPILFFVNQFELVSFTNIEKGWTVLDFLGKAIQTALLMQMRFQTSGQRSHQSYLEKLIKQKDAQIANLQETLSHKSGFMSQMAHDLRMPLNGIIGLSESLLLGTCGPLTPKVSHTMSTVMNSGTKLLYLINDIIDAADLCEGPLNIKIQRVDLEPCVRNVTEFITLMSTRSVTIKDNVPTNLPPVASDTARLTQMLANLMMHAVKSTRRGSVTIDARFNMAMVQITVTDSSKGMTQSAIAHIMDIQPHPNPVQNMGLRLVRQLVHSHNGELNIVSSPQGCTYTINLPVWKADTSSMAELEHLYSTQQLDCILRTCSDSNDVDGTRGVSTPDKHASTDLTETTPRVSMMQENNSASTNDLPGEIFDTNEQPGGDKMAMRKQPHKPSHCQQYGFVRVLSVDDDPVNQMVIQNLLAPMGYEIVQAMDGIEALEFLQSETTLPDVVLLDVMMPGMTGYEVCRRLRCMYPDALIPVIMVSAKSKKEHIVEGLRAGSNDYVTKPFGREEILARIEAHLRFKDAVTSQIKNQTTNDLTSEAPDDERGLAMGDDDLDDETRPGRTALASALAAKLNGGNLEALHESYAKLTLMAVGITNLQALRRAKSGKVLLMLKEFFVMLDGLLAKYDVYKVDDFGSTIMLAAGLEDNGSHAARMLDMARELHAGAEAICCNRTPLKLRIGLAVGKANGVVTSMQYPSLAFYGQAAVAAMLLESTCPSACVHVSRDVVAEMPSADAFIAIGSGEHTSYLLRSVAAHEVQAEGALSLMLESTNELSEMTAAKHALKPMQSALVYMTTVTPHLLRGLELGNVPYSGEHRAVTDALAMTTDAAGGAARGAAPRAPAGGAPAGEQESSKVNFDGKERLSADRSSGPDGSDFLNTELTLHSLGGDPHIADAQQPADADTAAKCEASAAKPAMEPEEAAGVRAFLKDFGLSEHADTLIAEGITRSRLPQLDDQQLIQMGLNAMGARFRLLQACASLDSPSQQ